MTDLFIYDKEDFASTVVYCWKGTSSVDIRELIDVEFPTASKTFRNSVFRRIIALRVGGDWWLEDSSICNHTKTTRELVAIWKIVLSIMRYAVYSTISVNEFASERLAEVEIRVMSGEINEQTYIEHCDWIKKCKEKDEALMDCCSCCPIGSMNQQEGGKAVLRIMCLPSGWDVNSTCVRFD